MSNPILTKAFVAAGNIRPNTFVMLQDPAGTSVLEGTGATSRVLGVCELGGKVGETVDVVLLGIAQVTLSNNITLGSTLTCSANGRAANCPAPSSTGDFAYAAGIALTGGAAGDIIPILLK